MKYLVSFLLLAFSSFALAVSPMAKMEAVGSNINITFTDFADAGPFETYTCNIDFGNHVYVLSAQPVSVNGDVLYECIDQGGLSSGVAYDVWFTFEDHPYDRVSQSATFTLKAN